MSFNNLDTLYRQVIMDHYKNPRNKGTIDGDAITVEMNNPSCGDRIEVYLSVKDGIVEDVKFDGEGCSISLASASMMTQAIKGKKLTEALKMSEVFSEMMLGKDVDAGEIDLDDIEALHGVSKFPARINCATLAWKALEKSAKEENV
ncbi:SUF system NifU family Fe-S cluster assembly protein [Virgibacillus sp. MSJ-26]|uniref:Fe-S cluster assembly sulfur transfer protein SufU n=1 Tax=Virgibacillus sp. MSJ-26 TaxID=2841522 RepID=UPI001C1172A2|nr:SUF system NifU family Fe-S cluster assembly protein [Virgibacillus sp. MSJ-26]MBU5467252.1 SUF system NifU family Fe-S cluster assembly protein [Virgibacillus sp. MSJ-26]